MPAFLSAPSCERVEILKPPSLVEGIKVCAARQYQHCYFSHLLILVLGFRNPALLYKCTLLLGDTVGEELVSNLKEAATEVICFSCLKIFDGNALAGLNPSSNVDVN